MALKATCGGFGTTGRAVLPDGTLAAVVEDGAYRSGDIFLCKCNDVGKIIRSTFRTTSAFGNLFVDRSDAAFGQPPYVQYTGASLLTVPLPTNEAIDQCNRYAATLPSWLTSDSIPALLQTWDFLPVVVDVNVSGTNIVWTQAQTIQNATLAPVSACARQDDVCAAINFNNVAYAQSGTALTDGLFAATGLFVANFALAQAVDGPWYAEFWPTLSGVYAVANCTGTCSVAATPCLLTCTGHTTRMVLSGAQGTSLQEIRVFQDKARV